jgi:hypothetical protein
MAHHAASSSPETAVQSSTIAFDAAAELRLRCRRHAALLAAAILGMVAARSSSTHAPIVLAFACYGALHGAALCASFKPRPARLRALAFVAAAALLSGSLARLGLTEAAFLAGRGIEAAALLVVAGSAFAGALGYGALLRYLLRYPLAPGPLVTIAFACMFASCAALVLLRQYPMGGGVWLAVLWWIAFSGGLCAAAGASRSGVSRRR